MNSSGQRRHSTQQKTHTAHRKSRTACHWPTGSSSAPNKTHKHIQPASGSWFLLSNFSCQPHPARCSGMSGSGSCVSGFLFESATASWQLVFRRGGGGGVVFKTGLVWVRYMQINDHQDTNININRVTAAHAQTQTQKLKLGAWRLYCC